MSSGLASVKCEELSISNQNLNSEQTQMMVGIMESDVERLNIVGNLCLALEREVWDGAVRVGNFKDIQEAGEELRTEAKLDSADWRDTWHITWRDKLHYNTTQLLIQAQSEISLELTNFKLLKRFKRVVARKWKQFGLLDISILFEDFLVWLIPNFTASKDFIKFYVLSLEYQLLVESNGVKLRDARHKKWYLLNNSIHYTLIKPSSNPC